MPPKYKMRCHYDVLGVNRDADDAELKRAYRKLALEWHPDKNAHRQEEAEERFKEVRGAYETLSDPNERAWYDSHREAILKAGKHAAGGEDMRPEDEIDLMPYFTSNAFRGFGDDPGGFYRTYETLFAALDKQEQAASLAAGKDHYKASPAFGASDAPWTQVKSFYAHWALFATMKTFAWADEYNLAEAQNRKVRRLMDEENKKLRRAEAREFNDTVRQLIAFIRKRDKRFIAHSAEQAKLEKARAAAAERKRMAAKKAKAEAASAYVEADWAQAEAPEWLTREIEKEEEAKARKEAQKQDLYCPVCKKKFKSQKQWENHEQSKQHKAAVQRLKEQMMEDEEVVKAALEDEDSEGESDDEARRNLRENLRNLDLDENDENDENDETEAETEDEEERKDLYRNWVPKDKSKNPRLASEDEEDSEDESGSDEDEDEDAALARMMGHARTKAATPRANVDSDSGDGSSSGEPEDEDDALERMMRTKRRVAFKQPVVVDDAGEQYGSDSDSETESVTTVGRAERLARNKPRALLKKGKLNARKKDVEAPVAASNPLHLLDSDSDALAEGDEDEDDEGVAAAARRASMFDVLDAEVVDDGAGATPAPDDDDDDDGAREEAAAKKPNRRAKKKGFEKPAAEAGANKIRCQLCKMTFASGNALHKHLKDAHSGVHKKKR